MNFFYLSKNLIFDYIITHNFFNNDQNKSTHYILKKTKLPGEKNFIDSVYVGTSGTLFIVEGGAKHTGLSQHYHKISEKECLKNLTKKTKLLHSLNNKKTNNLKKQLKNIKYKKQNSISVAIINGVGGGMGDSIMGLAALRILWRKLRELKDEVIIDLYQDFTTRNKLIYRQEPMVNSLIQLPVSLYTLKQYDLIIDLSECVLEKEFNEMHMTDFFLKKFAIDPNSIFPEKKHPIIRIDKNAEYELLPVFEAINIDRRPLLLVHPVSSTLLRNIPEEKIISMMDFLISKTDYLLISICPLPYKNDRYVNLTELSVDFDFMTYIISRCDAVITVDTSVLHIAGALSIPTLAVFSSIKPEFRTAYYDNMESWLLMGDENPLLGVHGCEDQEAVKKIWDHFDYVDIPSIILKLKKSKLSKLKNRPVPCPICSQQVYPIISDEQIKGKMTKCFNCSTKFIVEPNNFVFQNIRYSRHQNSHDDNKKEIKKTFYKIIEFLKYVPQKRALLDLGSGTQYFVEIAKDLGFDAYGNELVEPSSTNSVLRNMRIMYTPPHYPVNYQIITSLDLLSLTDSPLNLAKKIRLKLEDGGLWIFATPNEESIQHFTKSANGCHYLDCSFHKSFFNYPIKMNKISHKYLVTNSGFFPVAQFTSDVTANTVMDCLGGVPNFNLSWKDGESFSLDKQNVTNIIFSYINPFLKKIKDCGGWLITIAKKI